MKNDIILAGVGGQGILSIAATIGTAALKNNLYIKQSEVHGMSQRGGAVQSHLRVSSQPIASDLVPMGGADLVISVEPMESLRYLPFLSPTGWVITNTEPFININDYPDIQKIIAEIKSLKNHIALNADEIAKEIKSPRSSNIVMLGASSLFIDIKFSSFEDGIREIFGRKGADVVNINLEALRRGREFAEKNR